MREFLQDHSSEEEVRRLMTTDEGYDSKVWAQMAELGLQGLVTPEEFGGSGFTLAEVGLVLEEMGRVLLCAPYFSTVAIATPVLLHCGDEDAHRRYLPEAPPSGPSRPWRSQRTAAGGSQDPPQ